MSRSEQRSGFTRRGFAALTLAGGAGAGAFAQQATREITAASVPGDPAAPGPQEGTLPEEEPFQGPLRFTRKDVNARVQPFAGTEVRLLPSRFLDAQQANQAVLRRIPAERLIHAFRLNAGISSSAQPLGGWEKPDCEIRGCFAGHFLTASAHMYASTGDENIKAKADSVVAGLAECQARLRGGYLSAFPIELFDRLNARREVWAPFYTIHKIMAGLLEMYRICGNKQALETVGGLARWADAWTAAVPEEHMQAVLDTEYGGMNEVLYNLAAITGDDKFAEAGDRFTKKRFFNLLALGCDRLRGLHTNTHIPQVTGAARRYELSGDRRFRDVATFFWDQVTGARCYATGGTSNNEGWLTGPHRLAAELGRGEATNECCCAYNMLKLTRKLYSWSADPRYFDYYERVLYNHRLGTIDLGTGATQYYLGLVPGSWRTFCTEYDSFWCCTGTGAEEFSKLNDSIYFHDDEGLYVNLFIPSEVRWAERGVRVRQETGFPEVASTTLRVTCSVPTAMPLYIRIPAWVSGAPAVKVNGRPVEVSASPASYVRIARTWDQGDQVEIALPMQLRLEPMPDDPGAQAVFYGPLLLAGRFGREGLMPELVVGPMGPQLKKAPPLTLPPLAAAEIRPEGRPLAFRTARVGLVPFNQVSDQRYTVYWKTG
ncbi:MAG: beta-L-arabinofuranosidase domain-containing protein [Bryobacteraceae bacterium]|jgi:DUF1680 family protein